MTRGAALHPVVWIWLGLAAPQAAPAQSSADRLALRQLRDTLAALQADQLGQHRILVGAAEIECDRVGLEEFLEMHGRWGKQVRCPGKLRQANPRREGCQSRSRSTTVGRSALASATVPSSPKRSHWPSAM